MGWRQSLAASGLNHISCPEGKKRWGVRWDAYRFLKLGAACRQAFPASTTPTPRVLVESLLKGKLPRATLRSGDEIVSGRTLCVNVIETLKQRLNTKDIFDFSHDTIRKQSPHTDCSGLWLPLTAVFSVLSLLALSSGSSDGKRSVNTKTFQFTQQKGENNDYHPRNKSSLVCLTGST